MSKKTIQDILPLVEQPSRYLGSEVNRVKKDLNTVKLRFALAFPDLYEIGTSHFGLQILYHILNRQAEIAAERVFAPGLDLESHLRSAGIPIASLESRMPLDQFDIIGFSLLYELNYTNILLILDLANIPFLASQRDASFPFIIAGGPCTCNPEPVADFFDAIVVGDGENVILNMSRAWLQWKDGAGGKRETLLKMWSEIEGVYIPAFFEPDYDDFGFQRLKPRFSHYKKVTRAIITDLDKAAFPDAPVLPFAKPVHDRLRLEVSRGCTRGCRFCQAGMIYRPVRERSLDTLLDLTEASLATTGYEDLSLLSLSTSDYGSIVPLMEQLMARCEAQRIAVSFPSLRAGTLTPELMKLIKKVRKTGFTIAPEAGSQRLRDVINKNITTQNIKDTVSHAFNLGWQVIKLYFMIGLPTETEADLQAIVALVKDLRRIKNQAGPKRRKGKINVSVTSFIPKPHTPFQWAPQISLSDSKEKIEWLQNQLRMSGVHFKWQKPEVSQIEGIWSRGDRRLSRLLVAAYQKGCRFDGWTDQFHYHAWQSAISDIALDIDFYTSRTRNMSEPMPWDIIDARVTRDYLREEWEKAVGGELTSDCRQGDCNACGVCDFEIIEPKVTVPDRENNVKMPSFRVQENQDSFYQKIKVSYSKLGPAKYFGHLELVKIFIRAIRRAGIPVKFSEGFHPKPKISFDDPLPIGMESLNETLIMTVPGQVRPIDIISDLNKHLPEGIVVQSCRLAPLKSARNSPDSADYQVSLKAGSFDQNKLEHYLKTPERIIARSNRKGKLKKINLKDIILKIKLLHPNQLYMKLKLEPGKTIRPNEVIRNIFNLSEEDVKKVRVLKGVAD